MPKSTTANSLKISKPCAIVTSLGRTGTQFFGKRFGKVIPDSTVVHEPDVIWLTRPSEWLGKIRQFGLYPLTLGRFSAKHSLRMLASKRQMGAIRDEDAIRWLSRQRRDFVQRSDGHFYLEANNQFAPLLDLLPEVMTQCRIIYIIRDPRSWVTSWMNFATGFYGSLDWRSRLNCGRLTAKSVNDPRYAILWPNMDRFGRLCWAWNWENAFALDQAERTDKAKVFRYEDLFESENRIEHFKELVAFIREVSDEAYDGAFDETLLDRKVHSTRDGAFPHWSEWSPSLAKTLDECAGTLMRRFNYGTEDDWLEKLN